MSLWAHSRMDYQFYCGWWAFKSIYLQKKSVKLYYEAIPSMNVTEQCSLFLPLALTRSGIELSLHRPNGIIPMKSERTYYMNLKQMKKF